MTKKRQEKQTLCSAIGHDWAHTMETDYRHCQRTGCQRIQHFVNGYWINVKHARKTEKQQQAGEGQQPSLFAE